MSSVHSSTSHPLLCQPSWLDRAGLPIPKEKEREFVQYLQGDIGDLVNDAFVRAHIYNALGIPPEERTAQHYLEFSLTAGTILVRNDSSSRWVTLYKQGEASTNPELEATVSRIIDKAYRFTFGGRPNPPEHPGSHFHSGGILPGEERASRTLPDGSSAGPSEAGDGRSRDSDASSSQASGSATGTSSVESSSVPETVALRSASTHGSSTHRFRSSGAASLHDSDAYSAVSHAGNRPPEEGSLRFSPEMSTADILKDAKLRTGSVFSSHTYPGAKPKSQLHRLLRPQKRSLRHSTAPSQVGSPNPPSLAHSLERTLTPSETHRSHHSKGRDASKSRRGHRRSLEERIEKIVERRVRRALNRLLGGVELDRQGRHHRRRKSSHSRRRDFSVYSRGSEGSFHTAKRHRQSSSKHSLEHRLARLERKSRREHRELIHRIEDAYAAVKEAQAALAPLCRSSRSL